jgi:GT2 family glycosyltransferase
VTSERPPHVAILTVTTNAAGHLGAYFDALEAVTYSNWSLTVVDNASSDGSPEIVRKRRPVANLLENESNLGFTGACNRALAILREDEAIDYVLFLNDDTEVTPDFLEPLVEFADAQTFVAPKTYLANQPGLLDDAAGEFDWWRGTWKRRVLGREESPAHNRAREIDNANLSCLLVPRSAFHEVGLLDDAFFVYYDDTDFCRRALDAGYRIAYEPKSVVYHRKGATLGGQLSAFGCYYLARNRPYLMRKHLSLPRFAVFWAYYMATRAARVVLWTAKGRRDLASATLAGMRDFLLGRMGRRRSASKSFEPDRQSKDT